VAIQIFEDTVTELLGRETCSLNKCKCVYNSTSN